RIPRARGHQAWRRAVRGRSHRLARQPARRAGRTHARAPRTQRRRRVRHGLRRQQRLWPPCVLARLAPEPVPIQVSTARMFRADTGLDELNAMSRDTAIQALGIVFTGIGPDWLRATMPVDARTQQPYGLLHGGASVLLAET